MRRKNNQYLNYENTIKRGPNIMKNSRKILKILVCAIMVLVVSTFAVYAVLPSSNEGSKSKLVDISSILNSKNVVKAATYEEWKEEKQKFSYNKRKEVLSKDKLNQLYDKGYSLSDIENAERLSILSGRDVEEILNLKYDNKSRNLVRLDKTWEDIESELNANVNNKFDELKISKDKVSFLKNKKLSDKEIIEVGILSDSYGKDIDQIIKDLKSGKTYEQLDKEYWEERKIEQEKKSDNIKLNQKELDNSIKNELSEEDLKLSKEFGISQMIEMGYAKNLVEKYKTNLRHVLELKAKEKKWSAVISILEEEIK